MDEKRMKEVFADEAFAKSLFKMETPAEVKAALKGKGIDITEEEVIKLRDQLIAAANKDGDLDEEQLKEVAGGVNLLPIIKVVGPLLIEGIGSIIRNRW